jgi:hypothetical protein
MTAPNDREEWLDAMLTKQLPYLDDNGFTARVVEQLPPRRSTKRRTAVLAVFAALAAGVAAISPLGRLLPEAFRFTTHISALSLAAWVTVGLIVWGAAALAVMEEA